MLYIGLSGGPFKSRYYSHIKSFKNEKYEKETELSKFIWHLKRKKETFTINWSILKKSNTNRRDSDQCNLCMDEKIEILRMKGELINKRSEVISTCRHNKKPPNRAKIKAK